MSVVSPSSKVRDLGVVFDQYLTVHDHISGICKSTHFFHLRSIGIIGNLLTFDATAQLIQKQTRGGQTTYSRHSCRYYHNSGNQAHPYSQNTKST